MNVNTEMGTKDIISVFIPVPPVFGEATHTLGVPENLHKLGRAYLEGVEHFILQESVPFDKAWEHPPHWKFFRIKCRSINEKQTLTLQRGGFCHDW